MTITLSPEVVKILPILTTLPAEEKLQIIHILSNKEAFEQENNAKGAMTLAEFSARMKKRNLANGRKLSVEEMNESIEKMFENWDS